MENKQQFDFWYAVNHTELILRPTSRLETFGDTIVNYCLLCELMDNPSKIRIREGQLKALKPAIITPQSLGQINISDFGPEAHKYADWLAENSGDLMALQYGFRIEKNDLKEYIVTDQIKPVLERVQQDMAERDDPLSAVLVGVDTPWEVCLIKLMVDLVQRSAPRNLKDIRHYDQNELTDRIERAFLDAARAPEKINALAHLLRHHGLWEKHEDRFFALVRSTGSHQPPENTDI